MKLEIQIPRKIIIKLLHFAQQSPTKEICGLIGSVNGLANTCYPIKNTAKVAETNFQLDAKQQINAFTAMRYQNEDFFAIYHSHPTSSAIPSALDIKLATYPKVIYLIISLNTKGVLEMRGFSIAHKTVKNLDLRLSED